MAGKNEPGRALLVRALFVGVGLAALLWQFPLFRVVRLPPPSPAGDNPATAPGAFDARTAAEKVWKADLPAASARATEVTRVIAAVRENAETARSQLGKAAGMGVSYYFVRGEGRVVARERNTLHVAFAGADKEIVAIRIGPVFGNVVRDGCGFLDLNAFPGLQEFNALSAELNALVEKTVLPALRDKAQPGATIRFAGCAEAPESAADPGEPLLTIVPVQAEVR